jgi:hypothetical protein
LKGNLINSGRFIPFSERNGYVKTYKAFGWVFKILKPSKL